MEGDDAASNNPFEGLPMFAEMAKAMSGQGPLNWDVARQFALLAAPQQSNVSPTSRIAFERLLPIAALQVGGVTGWDGATPELVTLTPSTWSQRALEAYRPLFTEMATSLTQPPAGHGNDDSSSSDPMMAMLGQLSRMMAPSMMGMAVGGMVGRLAVRAFGEHDLPIPRPQRHIAVVPDTVDAFAEQWSLQTDEMRLWVLAHEITGHVLFSQGTVAADLSAMVRGHVGGFRPDPSAVADHLASLGNDPSSDPMAALQQAFGDPAVILGAIESADQAALAPRLHAAVAAVVGYIDYIVDSVAVRLIGGNALQIAEAVRRRRLETTTEDVYIERLLGLRLDQAQVQRGKEFVGGAVDRIGEVAVTDAFSRPQALPTPAELEAPGLWLARLGIE